MRRRVLSIVGERWRHYKTELVSEYIYGPSVGARPPNPTISDEDWAQFVEKKSTPAHQALRKKHQAIARKNVTPHTLSRGGYDRLKEAKMKEKTARIEAMSAEDSSTLRDPPSPPSRHELWKDARKKKGGQYTTDEAAEITQKIVS
ncbi:hypothetical protein Fmac_023426 [Flemingia macrophylla]|uniref:Uncharacterized protein n=1 Tax=Flemingia macrophylla TaxID=520843 RepID=A0ABD1LLN8_9FABA